MKNYFENSHLVFRSDFIEEAKINELERRNQINFPQSYRDFLQFYSHIADYKIGMKINILELGHDIVQIDGLYNYFKLLEFNWLDKDDTLVKSGFFPIGDTLLGFAIAIGWKRHNSGFVYLIDTDESWLSLRMTFSDFINNLHEL